MVPYFIGLAFRIFGDFGGDAAAKRKGDLVVGEAAPRRKRERENSMYALLFSLPPRPPLLAPPPHSHFIFPEEEEKKPPFGKNSVSRKYQKFGKRGKGRENISIPPQSRFRHHKSSRRVETQC